MGLDIPAGDSDVAAIRDFADEGWQQLGRMLKICINHGQKVRVSMCPAVDNGTGQSSLAGTHEKTHAGFGLRRALDYVGPRRQSSRRQRTPTRKTARKMEGMQGKT
jgi:hypothetical protein